MEGITFALDLQLFDGGSGGGSAAGAGNAAGAGGGAGNGGEGASAAATQEIAALEDKRLKRNPLSRVRYGKQTAVAAAPQTNAPRANPDSGTQPANAGQEGSTGANETPEETFETLINGKYKKDFGERVQAIIADRLKNSHEAEEKLGKMAPMLEALGKKYGMAADDIEGLVASVTDDDSLYEEEAQAKGMSVQTLKQIKALERDKAEAERFRAQTQEEAALQAHFQRLVEQGNQVKQVFPNFDLREELRNPDFVRLTSPNVGVDVMTAYQVIHRDEIQPAAMQYAAQKSQEKLAASMQANARRPMENGVGGAGAAVEVRDDPRKWSAADREEVRRRVARGEKIIL